MAFRYLQYAAFIAATASFSRAQKSANVPDDLQTSLEFSDKELQVSYTNEAVNGFADGTTFEKDAVESEPTFALGDSSGISPTILYTIVLVDTTCPNARTLHYARANFKYNFDITNVNTSSTALLEYKAPGAFGETGNDRQYSWLMYTNPKRKEISELKLPTEGEAFDVGQWQSDNGLEDPSAGVGMVVKLGGTANCDGEAVQSTATLGLTSPGSVSTSARIATTTTTKESNTAMSTTATGIISSGSFTRTSTTSGNTAEQTTSAASELSVAGGMAVVLFAAAGILF